MATPKYPIDIQSFSEIINGKYLYVDKTALIHQMAQDYQYVFISRPQRFGKSLLCNTLTEYLSGNKDLFKGLAIEQLEQKWTKHPVLSFSFEPAYKVNKQSLNDFIGSMLAKYEQEYGITPSSNDNGERLSNIIKAARKKSKQKVAVIIDAYDTPVLGSIQDSDLVCDVQNTIGSFLAPLDSLAKDLRFVFVTGEIHYATRCYRNALSKIHDISHQVDYDTICGFTNDEVTNNLPHDIQGFADVQSWTFDEALKWFGNIYGGYNFSKELRTVFNPGSLLCSLHTKKTEIFWPKAASAIGLIKMTEKMFEVTMSNFDGIQCTADRFEIEAEENLDLVPFLVQAGYLTFKNFEIFNNTEYYTLRYANNEIRAVVKQIG